ncbi:MAG: MlaD family protein [Crocinitomicaceae bacterium]|nr:MlaD family protein [Crocinitomicaceae bacterium]
MRSLAFIGFLLLLLASCQRDDKVVYILFFDSEGLSEGQDVLLNGVSVGKVLDVDLTDKNEVISTVELSESVDFPKDTQFEIQSQDVFTKIILVTLGESETMIQTGDTIQGIMTIDPLDLMPPEHGKPKLLDEVKEMLKN